MAASGQRRPEWKRDDRGQNFAHTTARRSGRSAISSLDADHGTAPTQVGAANARPRAECLWFERRGGNESAACGDRNAKANQTRTAETEPPKAPADDRNVPHYPMWWDVIARYPEINDVAGQGGADLCVRCTPDKDGFLSDCAVAGEMAPYTKVRTAAKKMASMIRETHKDGTPYSGKILYIPISFKIPQPIQTTPNYCKSVHTDANYIN
jgi:hypothetical protein